MAGETGLAMVDESELALAKAVQEALLAREVPKCRCGEVAVRNRMCEDVGGDFYHFRRLNEDQIALTFGDVLGHGVSAALIMTLIMGVLDAERAENHRPGHVVSQINDLLVRLGDQADTPIICSLIYAVVDLPSGILLFINAGHPTPIVHNRDSQRSKKLIATSMLLGVQPGVQPEFCHQFQKNDRLVLFTDGVSDARNEDGECFGLDRLGQAVKESAGESCEVLTERLFGKVDEFLQYAPANDDQTVLVIDFDNVLTSS